jgi:hypothetical protein
MMGIKINSVIHRELFYYAFSGICGEKQHNDLIIAHP